MGDNRYVSEPPLSADTEHPGCRPSDPLRDTMMIGPRAGTDDLGVGVHDVQQSRSAGPVAHHQNLPVTFVEALFSTGCCERKGGFNCRCNTLGLSFPGILKTCLCCFG